MLRAVMEGITLNLGFIVNIFRNPVPGYDGRPIGISDVLELYDADGSEFYYCDRVGFRQIEFAPQQEMDLCP